MCVVDDDEVDLPLALDREELDAMRAAPAVHATLAAAMGEETYRHWIAVESFRRQSRSRFTDAAGVPDPLGAPGPASRVWRCGPRQGASAGKAATSAADRRAPGPAP